MIIIMIMIRSRSMIGETARDVSFFDSDCAALRMTRVRVHNHQALDMTFRRSPKWTQPTRLPLQGEGAIAALRPLPHFGGHPPSQRYGATSRPPLQKRGEVFDNGTRRSVSLQEEVAA
jgi:hypothetical protein